MVSYQSLNLNEAQGDHAELASWACAQTPASTELRWWETAASAGSSLGVYMMIAMAARHAVPAEEATAIEEAYFPWIGSLHLLLDSLVDQQEDRVAGQPSLLALLLARGGCRALGSDRGRVDAQDSGASLRTPARAIAGWHGRALSVDARCRSGGGPAGDPFGAGGHRWAGGSHDARDGRPSSAGTRINAPDSQVPGDRESETIKMTLYSWEADRRDGH